MSTFNTGHETKDKESKKSKSLLKKKDKKDKSTSHGSLDSSSKTNSSTSLSGSGNRTSPNNSPKNSSNSITNEKLVSPQEASSSSPRSISAASTSSEHPLEFQKPNHSNRKVIKFFGDEHAEVDSNKHEYAPQPRHVKEYKLNKRFGEAVPALVITPSSSNATEHAQSSLPPLFSDDNCEQEDDLETSEWERKRLAKKNLRMQRFFGQAFDVEIEEHYAKTSSLATHPGPPAPLDTPPSPQAATKTKHLISLGKSKKKEKLAQLQLLQTEQPKTQPATVDIIKLNKFFGFRIDISKKATKFKARPTSRDDNSFVTALERSRDSLSSGDDIATRFRKRSTSTTDTDDAIEKIRQNLQRASSSSQNLNLSPPQTFPRKSPSKANIEQDKKDDGELAESSSQSGDDESTKLSSSEENVDMIPIPATVEHISVSGKSSGKITRKKTFVMNPQTETATSESENETGDSTAGQLLSTLSLGMNATVMSISGALKENSQVPKATSSGIPSSSQSPSPQLASHLDDSNTESSPEESSEIDEVRQGLILENIRAKKLRRMFGENITEEDANGVQFAPQPSNIKASKINRHFGAVVVEQPEVPHDRSSDLDVSEDEDILNELRDNRRVQRLRVFFGSQDLNSALNEPTNPAPPSGHSRSSEDPL